MMGVAFGYFGIAPLSLQFLGNYELGDVASRIAVMSYVKTVASITLVRASSSNSRCWSTS